MKTIKLTRENLKPRPDLGEDWYEWEGCDTRANIEIDEGISLYVTGYIETNGGCIFTDGDVNIKGWRIETDGGCIYTDGDVKTNGGCIITNDGCIFTDGDVNTDGNINNNNGYIKTNGGYIG
jgi:hypothetical protein